MVRQSPKDAARGQPDEPMLCRSSPAWSTVEHFSSTSFYLEQQLHALGYFTECDERVLLLWQHGKQIRAGPLGPSNSLAQQSARLLCFLAFHLPTEAGLLLCCSVVRIAKRHVAEDSSGLLRVTDERLRHPTLFGNSKDKQRRIESMGSTHTLLWLLQTPPSKDNRGRCEGLRDACPADKLDSLVRSGSEKAYHPSGATAVSAVLSP
ncbi:hypothetical protein GE09DRAFT_716186 [Coniochaeta sp. 2T2.1]|nr:hypothetical protein GE09DRAFT_716186 [Coniochaeta sp. 2T2.1]